MASLVYMTRPCTCCLQADSEGDPSRTPSTHFDLGRYAMYDLNGDGHVTMQELVHATFFELFPDSFQTVLEVRNHKASHIGRSRSLLLSC